MAVGEREIIGVTQQEVVRFQPGAETVTTREGLVLKNPGIIRRETIGEAWQRSSMNQVRGIERFNMERDWIQMEAPKILPIYDAGK